MGSVTLPRSLLSDLPGAPASCLRLWVTAWVLAGDRRFGRSELAACREVFVAAAKLWPRDRLNRPGRLTVVSILLELEAMGVVTAIEAVFGGYRCTVCGEETAA